MPSPKTEPARGWADRIGWPSVKPRGFTDWLKQLNVRLILVLAAVTLVALLTSGIAISQILPGYFIEQATQSLRTAAGATGIDLQQRINEAPTNQAQVAELRETFILPVVAVQSARNNDVPATDPVTTGHLLATVMHHLFDLGGVRVARGLPSDLVNLLSNVEPIPGVF